MTHRKHALAARVLGVLVAATAVGAGGVSPAQAVVAPPEIVGTYVTPVVGIGISKPKDTATAAAVRGATSVVVAGERATPGLCAGYDETLRKDPTPDENDPTIFEYGSVATLDPADFRDIGGNGCAGRWKLTYTAKGSGGTDTAVAYQYLLRASRFTTLNAGPEPIRAGTAVTTTGTLQRASWWDQRYYGWVTPVLLQFRTTGAWKTYRTLTPSSTGLVRGTVVQKVSGCWRMVAPGTSTTVDATSIVDCVAVG